MPCVPYTAESRKEEDFFFSELQERRESAARALNNGFIRCTMEGKAHKLIPGSYYTGSSDKWERKHLALTNAGLMIFENKKLG